MSLEQARAELGETARRYAFGSCAIGELESAACHYHREVLAAFSELAMEDDQRTGVADVAAQRGTGR